MCAAEQQCVDKGVGSEQPAKVGTDKIIGSGFVGLAVFYQRNPHRASLLVNSDMRIEFGYLDRIRVRQHCAFGGEYPDMACAGIATESLDSGAYDAKHTMPSERAFPIALLLSPDGRQVALLDSSECLCGGGITGKDDELTALREEIADSLPRVFIDHIERARAVWGTGVIAEVEIVVLRQTLADGL